jgi:hypothetical protein
VVAACDAAGWSTSAYYGWAAGGVQEPTASERLQADLVAEIRGIHADSDGVYGGRHA